MRLGLLLAAAAVLAGCASDKERRFEFSQVLMGVAGRVVLYAPDEGAARDAAAAAFGRIAELDAVMSDYRPDSELMRLCDRAGGEPVGVSDDLMRILVRAGEVSEASGGAFDVTTGPLVALWREARQTGEMPEAAALEAARGSVGYRNVEIDRAARVVRLTVEGMRLDLGGIGKGFASDEAVKTLRERGRARCLVSLAGDVVAGDAPPGERGWNVAVERPDGSVEMMLLANRAVTSSGDTGQFVEIGGRRYSHIVDPATGLGLTNRIGVTVTAPDGATADALATAVCVLGASRGRALVADFPGAEVEVFEARERAGPHAGGGPPRGGLGDDLDDPGPIQPRRQNEMSITPAMRIMTIHTAK